MVCVRTKKKKKKIHGLNFHYVIHMSAESHSCPQNKSYRQLTFFLSAAIFTLKVTDPFIFLTLKRGTFFLT